MKYILKTLGCKANLHDSQVIEHDLQKQGWVPSGDDASVDLCIINSCSVTDEADKQVKRLAVKLARENPSAKVVVTGCAAEISPEAFAKSPGVHYLVGNQNKGKLVELITSELKSKITSHILSSDKILGTLTPYSELISRHPIDREWPSITTSFEGGGVHSDSHASRTRAFLKIQEGCDAFCTYCIIPYGRGPSRSLSINSLVTQVQNLVANGVREVILTGTNIGDYGSDWGKTPQFEALIENLLGRTELERLRLSSLDPSEITPRLLKMMEESSRLCAHFHVSLQSPHSRILKLMKRGYTYEQVESCLNSIAALGARLGIPGGVFVGMDVITGFPGETDEEFEWGYQILSALPWTRLHVFPYSERAGTPATRLPGAVRPEIRAQRAKRLNALSMERLTQFYRQILDQKQITLTGVLMERSNPGGWASGYTSNYLRVLIRGLQAQNAILDVQAMELMIDPSGRDVGLVANQMTADQRS